MQALFREIRRLIAAGDYDALTRLEYHKPEYFNWVTEIFEGIHVKDTPEATALLWTDGSRTERYTFRQIGSQANQLLNFLRLKGLQQDEVLLTQLSL